MNKFFENIFGITKIREAAEASTKDALKLAADANEAARVATEGAKRAAEIEAIANASPKERATAKKEPWVDVLKVNVNDENMRNGFFELDWNDLFIDKLKLEGYGASGDKDEEIVDRWFRELCAGIVVDGDYGGVVTGNLNVADVIKDN